MRIVLVVPGGVDPPGSERVIPFVHHLVERTSARHDVTVLALGHDPQPGRWRLFDAEVVNIPIGAHSRGDIVRVLRESAAIVRAQSRPDVIHALWANLPGLTAGLLGRRLRVPTVVSVGGGELASVPEIGYGGGLARGPRLLARTSLRLATRVTVATAWMRAHVASLAGRAPDEIVPLGADARWFHPASDPARGTAADRFVHVGSLNRVKDQDLLLRGFARHLERSAASRLVVAGADTLQGHHAALAASLGIADHVTFTGWLPPQQLADVLREADWHVLTSHHDAGPVAVAEAAACGVPTVGIRVGHVADFTDPRVTSGGPAALAIEHRSPESVADALDRARRRGVREPIAAAALRWGRAHDADATAEAFELLYRRVARR